MTSDKITKKNYKGFTLIELLVVIGILAVLLAITLIAINPARQFSQANNTQRQNDVNAILNAINQYVIDSQGTLPTGLAAGDDWKQVSSSGTGADFCNNLVPKYIASLPIDPQTGSYTDCATYQTSYVVSVSNPAAGDSPRVSLYAPDVELSATVSATR